jgi:hypothetical protein
MNMQPTYNRNDFTERSTRMCAILYFMVKKITPKLQLIMLHLNALPAIKDNLGLALLGQLRCANLSPDSSITKAAEAATKYINSGIGLKEGIIEARLSLARYDMRENRLDSAFAGYQYVLKETKNAMAAESKYQIANIQYIKKDYKKSKKLYLS